MHWRSGRNTILFKYPLPIPCILVAHTHHRRLLALCRSKHPPRNPADILRRHLRNLLRHVRHWDPMAMHKDLSPQILHLDRPALQSHHQTRLELILCTLKLDRRNGSVKEEAELVHEVRHDLARGIPTAYAGGCGDERGEQAEEGRVGVDVVEGGAVVDLGEVVENVGVKTGVHALSGTTCEIMC